jgi:hypothetical protein
MPGNGVSCSEGSRQADFTSTRTEIRNQQDPQNPSYHGGVVTELSRNRDIVAVWEIETDSLLPNGDDSVSCYNDGTCTYVKETIHQQAGHHISARDMNSDLRIHALGRPFLTQLVFYIFPNHSVMAASGLIMS